MEQITENQAPLSGSNSKSGRFWGVLVILLALLSAVGAGWTLVNYFDLEDSKAADALVNEQEENSLRKKQFMELEAELRATKAAKEKLEWGAVESRNQLGKLTARLKAAEEAKAKAEKEVEEYKRRNAVLASKGDGVRDASGNGNRVGQGKASPTTQIVASGTNGSEEAGIGQGRKSHDIPKRDVKYSFKELYEKCKVECVLPKTATVLPVNQRMMDAVDGEIHCTVVQTGDQYYISRILKGNEDVRFYVSPDKVKNASEFTVTKSNVYLYLNQYDAFDNKTGGAICGLPNGLPKGTKLEVLDYITITAGKPKCPIIKFPGTDIRLLVDREFMDLYISASQGDSEAQCKLAEKYEKGNGVGKNMPKAVAWYRKAATAGNELAKARLENLRNGNGLTDWR